VPPGAGAAASKPKPEELTGRLRTGISGRTKLGAVDANAPVSACSRKPNACLNTSALAFRAPSRSISAPLAFQLLNNTANAAAKQSTLVDLSCATTILSFQIELLLARGCPTIFEL
jgi:hypothetical protein